MITGLGRSTGEGIGYPFQYSGLGEFYTVHGVAKSQTQQSNFHFHLEKEAKETEYPRLLITAADSAGKGPLIQDIKLQQLGSECDEPSRAPKS